jgi:myosin-5
MSTVDPQESIWLQSGLDFRDNQSLINQLESGLFALINEQSILSNHAFRLKGLIDKLDSSHAFDQSSPIFRRISSSKLQQLEQQQQQQQQQSSSIFYIRHYVGDVSYTASRLTSKNNDSQPDDMVKFLRKRSRHEFLSQKLVKEEELMRRSLQQTTSNNSTSLANNVGRGGKRHTVLSKFKRSLDVLIGNLGKTNILYIRCIKPNHELVADRFDARVIRDQLNSAGLVALLNTHKHLYAQKMTYEQFVISYEKYT